MTIQSLYPAIRPSLNLDFANTKALDPRITFSRASTATYYDGKTVAKAEENLFKYSQEFDNAAWGRTGIAAFGSGSVANTTATADPAGGNTADFLLPYSASERQRINQSATVLSGVAATLSFYVKPSGYTKVALRENNTSGYYVSFDISSTTSPSILAKSSQATGTVTYISNGWFLCTMTTTISGTNFGGGVYVLDPSYTTGDPEAPVWSPNKTDGIYVWGAQLEQRSSATAYTPTTSQPITNYIPALQTAAANVARFDHNPTTGESLGLLIEEQRTNLLTYSEDFSNAYWGKNAGAVTANQAVAPDGTLSADLFTPIASAGSSAYVSENSTSISGSSFAYSVCVKLNGKRYVQIGATNAGVAQSYANFDLQTATIGSIGGSITASQMTALGNGWYRLSATIVASVNGIVLFFVLPVGSNTATYAAPSAHDGYSGIYLWGAQLEAGSFPTSYIPTVASQVTRSADSASMTGTNFSSWYRADEGTMYTEFVKPNSSSGSATPQLLSINDGTTSNRISIDQYGGNYWMEVTNNGAGQADASFFAPTANQFAKLALAYKVNDVVAVGNAGSVTSDTAVVLPTSLTTFSFTGSGTSATRTIRKIAYYPARLTNTQLQALTA